MANQNAGFMQKFMHWYESYQGKRVVGMVYSLGAAVVIVGALFKILHLPGAGPMLFCGMLTEALLFSIGCFDKPHPEFHWEEVFPQLAAYGTDPALLAELQARPRPTLLGAGVADGVAPAPTAGEAKPKTNVPALTNEDMEALKSGINDLAKTAVQLTELGKVATSTTKLGEKMDAASAAAEKFAGSQDALTATSEALGKAYLNVENEMQGVLAGTQNFGKGIENVTKSVDDVTKSVENVTKSMETVTKSVEVVNQSVGGVDQAVQTVNEKLSSLNAVYELQLNAVQSQIDAYKAQAAQVQALTNDVQKIQDAVNESAKYQEAYKASSKKLAEQIESLNKVYGNMLTALA